MLVHGVARHVVSIKIGAKLVVGVHINFLLQLSANIFVSVIISKMFVKFVVCGGLSLCCSRLLFFFLSSLLFSLVHVVGLLKCLIGYS